jgi:hypothetical protein
VDFVIATSEGVVSIDNQPLGVDTTTLPANVAVVAYDCSSGAGNIEYNDRLRILEPLLDPTPYQAVLNNWLVEAAAQTVMPVTLAQAQRVKIGIVNGIYNGKRQLPITAIGYTWDASDTAYADMQAAITSSTPGMVDTLTTQTNQQVGTLTTQTNQQAASLATQTNQQVATLTAHTNQQAASLAAQTNQQVATLTAQTNQSAASLAAQTNQQSQSLSIVQYVPAAAQGAYASAGGSATYVVGGSQLAGIPYTVSFNTASSSFVTGVAGGGITQQPQYYASNPVQIVSPIQTEPTAQTAPTQTAPTQTAPTQTAPTQTSPTQSTTAKFMPLNGRTALTLNVSQIGQIVAAIQSRRSSLQTVRLNKTGEINALNTISAVIAYDATTGWPS